MSAYATLTSRNLDPSDCEHDRREKFDSRRCLDCHGEIVYACAVCGEPDGSVYAEWCCENEDWVEV